MHTCTISMSATAECGKPAVSWFGTSRGERFYECAEHDSSQYFEANTEVGTLAEVEVHGVTKAGPIVKVTPTFIWVEVPIYGGASSRVVQVRR